MLGVGEELMWISYYQCGERWTNEEVNGSWEGWQKHYADRVLVTEPYFHSVYMMSSPTPTPGFPKDQKPRPPVAEP